MVYFAGYKQFIKKDIWAGKHICPHCNDSINHHLGKLVMRGYVFFVPIISISPKHFVICDRCGYAVEISRGAYKETHKSQWCELLANNFPPDIVLQDCHPNSLKIGTKRLAVALTGLLAFYMLLGCGLLCSVAANENEPLEFSSILVLLYLFAIGFVPLAFAIASMHKANVKRKSYLFALEDGKR